MSSMYPPYGSTPVQPCQRCGMPLPPNELYCGNCGQYNAPPQANNATVRAESSWGGNGSMPQTTYGSGQYGEQQWGQSQLQSPSNDPYRGSSASQQFYGGSNQPASLNSYYNAPAQIANPYGAPSQPSNTGDFYGTAAPQQPFYAASAPPNVTGGFQQGTPQGSEFNQLPGKRGPNLGLIVGIVLLIVAFVGGGIVGSLYFAKNATTTPTTSSSPTATPATPTPSVPALFSDSFTNNNNGWDLTSDPGGKFLVKVGGGSLIVQDNENLLLPELVPGGKSFSNFRLTVNAILSKGTQDNGYGVYIRGTLDANSNITTFYRFELYGDGTFAIFKGTVDGSGKMNSSRLVNYTPSSAILKKGSLNHITITANGPNMTFTVNGQTLSAISDTSYTSGLVALFVSNIQGSPPGAQATFQKLAIYPVSA